MKLTVEIDCGIIDVETDSETGRVDSVWVNGYDYADKTVEELIIALAGGQRKWSVKVADAEYDYHHADKGPDRMEDEFGVPV